MKWGFLLLYVLVFRPIAFTSEPIEAMGFNRYKSYAARHYQAAAAYVPPRISPPRSNHPSGLLIGEGETPQL